MSKTRQCRKNMKLAERRSAAVEITHLTTGTSTACALHKDGAWIVADATGVEVDGAHMSDETAYNLGVRPDFIVYCLPPGPLGKQLDAMGARR
jgi:hypothetical protein